MKRQTSRVSKRQLNREYESFVMNELYCKWIVMVSSKYIPKVPELYHFTPYIYGFGINRIPVTSK